MNIVQLTPGAGAMYCGNCFRDNALVSELRRMGHQVLMIPLYLPMTLDEPDESAGTPIFFSGINVYLEQKLPLFRSMPAWVHRGLSSPGLLKWAAGRAARTRAQDLGAVTLSMLRGEEGNQARELDELVAWLKTQPHPEIFCLSNALLMGMVRRLKTDLRCKVLCTLQGEDAFLDSLPKPHREACWHMLAERAAEADGFVAPSRYFGELMCRRLGLNLDKLRVVYNGIKLDGYEKTGPPPAAGAPPVLGFFARMCREKGLDTLVEAFIRIRRRAKVKDLRLRVGGSCGPGDEPLVRELRARLESEGLSNEATFRPNLSRDDKVEFLRSLTLFSVPSRAGEAFGLYVIEALAAGVPVVQPQSGAFPEVIERTGGGVLCGHEDPEALALAVEELLLDPARRQGLARAGQQTVMEQFSARAMAEATVVAYGSFLVNPDESHYDAAGASADRKRGSPGSSSPAKDVPGMLK